MDCDHHNIAGLLMAAWPLRRTGTLALWGMVAALAPVAPAAQEVAGPTTAAGARAPRVERADDGRARDRAALASGSVESQSDSGRSREAVAVVGVAEVESARSALVEAATDDAVDRLYEQIGMEAAGRQHRVEDVLKALPDSAWVKFRAALRNSPQIGGPRFADVRTTQVYLQVGGSEIGRVLVELVTEHSDRSPVTPEEVSRAVERWETRTFSGMGGSVRPEVAELLRPQHAEAESNSWSGVDADTTRDAILAAHDSAIDRVLELMDPVELPDAMPASDGPSAASTDPDGENSSAAPDEPNAQRDPETLKDLLEPGTAREDLRSWLADRPIVRLRFEEDRQIMIRISVGADDIVGYLAQRYAQEEEQAGTPVIMSEEQWQVVEERLARNLTGPITGRAAAPAAVAVDEEAPRKLALAATPPEWARTRITATGTVTGGNENLLLSRRAGSAIARDNLRQALLDLPVGEGHTVTDLVEIRPEVGELVERLVDSATPQAAYGEDESEVTVQLSVSGMRFWRMLPR